MKLLSFFSLALFGGTALLTHATWAQPAAYPPQSAYPGAVFRTAVPGRNAVGRPHVFVEITSHPVST